MNRYTDSAALCLTCALLACDDAGTGAISNRGDSATPEAAASSPGGRSGADDAAVLPRPGPPPRTVSLRDAYAIEGSGDAELVFVVELSEASQDPVAFKYTVAPLTATPGEDYVTAEGTLEFGPGDRRLELEVQIVGDAVEENDEVLRVTLEELHGDAEFYRAHATGVIVDDDAPVSPDANLTGDEPFEGPEGIRVFASPLGIGAPLRLEMNEIEMPQVPLPKGVTALGSAYLLRPDRLMFGRPDAPFYISRPAPEGLRHALEGGEELALALLQPQARLIDVADPDESEIWSLISSFADPERPGAAVAPLPQVAEGGAVLVWVKRPAGRRRLRDIDKRLGGLDASNPPSFIVRCNLFPAGASPCDDPAQVELLEASMTHVWEAFRDVGLDYPSMHWYPLDDAYEFYVEPTGTARCNDNAAIYDPAPRQIVLCDPSGRDATGNWRMEYLAHEYYHAHQYASKAFFAETDHALYLREGTADALASLVDGPDITRFAPRYSRRVYFSLKDNYDQLEYEAQDFWVYLLNVSPVPLDTLRQFFELGGTSQAVVDTVPILWPQYDLGDLYWDWVKNQYFEHTVDLGAVRAETTWSECRHLHPPALVASDATFAAANLTPLTADPVVLRLGGNPSRLAHGISVETVDPRDEELLRYKIYPTAENCASIPEGALGPDALPTSGFYGIILIANTSDRYSLEYYINID